MNGKILDELRELAAADNITTKSALRLMCTVQAGFAETIIAMDQRTEAAEEERAELKRSLEKLAENSDAQMANINELKEQLEKKVLGNPLVIFGNFMTEHPKIVASLFVLLVILSNLWFVSGFRRAILLLLKVPPEIIEAVAP